MALNYYYNANNQKVNKAPSTYEDYVAMGAGSAEAEKASGSLGAGKLADARQSLYYNNQKNASASGTAGSLSGTNLNELYNQAQKGVDEGSQNDSQSIEDEYNSQRDMLLGQLDYLGKQRETSLASLNLNMQNLQRQTEGQKTKAKDITETNIGQAGETANSVQRANRNTLRALGILGSSAAGDILAKPINQFGQQRAVLQKALSDRFNELDDQLNQKTDEHRIALQELENNYANLVSQVQGDMRFGMQDKKNSLESIRIAGEAKRQEIIQAQLQYEQQTKLEQQKLEAYVAQMSAYGSPTNDLPGILNTQLKPQAQGNNSNQQIGIAQGDYRKKLNLPFTSLSGL